MILFPFFIDEILKISLGKLGNRIIFLKCGFFSFLLFEITDVLNEDFILHLQRLAICSELFNASVGDGLFGHLELVTLLLQGLLNFLVLVLDSCDQVVVALLARPVQLLLELTV